SGAVLLPQDQIELVCPSPIELAEPAVLVAVRIRLLIFLPNQLQGDMFLVVQFLVNGSPMDSLARLASRRRSSWKQTRLCVFRAIPDSDSDRKHPLIPNESIQ